MATDAPEALTANLCWLLSRASHALTTEMSAALADSKLSPRAHEVLSAAVTGTYTQTELVKMIGLDKTTMVVTLDELEREGLAERRPAPTDRRARIVAVTAAGKRRLRSADKVLDRIRDDVLGTLAPREREVFVDALQQLVVDRLSTPAETPAPVRRKRMPSGKR